MGQHVASPHLASARQLPLCCLIQGSQLTQRISCRSLGSSISPLLELGGHSHWIWQAKYNPHHDSLLLSASSDSLVNLWHTPLTAEESSGRGSGGSRGPQTGGVSLAKGFGKDVHDGKACTYDDHEDSVYGEQSSRQKYIEVLCDAALGNRIKMAVSLWLSTRIESY